MLWVGVCVKLYCVVCGWLLMELRMMVVWASERCGEEFSCCKGRNECGWVWVRLEGGGKEGWCNLVQVDIFDPCVFILTH